MNLHINKEEFDFLTSVPNFGTFTIGSKLYGTNDENSDADYLIITCPSKEHNLSPFKTHHQFQYKDVENNIDYNFVDIITFIRNLVCGDSTINYELLYSEEFKASKIGWLCDYREYFRTFTIVKSYLGLCERDIKHFNKRKDKRDKSSGLGHIMRSFDYATGIVEGKFSLDRYSKSDHEAVKNINPDHHTLDDLKSQIKRYREYVVKNYVDRGGIVNYLDPDVQLRINRWIMVVLDYYPPYNLPDSLLMRLFETNEDKNIKY